MYSGPLDFSGDLDDYLQAIGGRDEFYVNTIDFCGQSVVVINYRVVKSDTFPPLSNDLDSVTLKKYMLRRNCRGIKFNPETKKVIAQPIHKFFNLNEREETQWNNILFKPHTIFDKVDGSMIHPVPIFSKDNHKIDWVFATKAGQTDISLEADRIIKLGCYESLFIFIMNCILHNKTPIFEFCSTKFPVVIKHDTDRFVLIAIRDNETGQYEFDWDKWMDLDLATAAYSMCDLDYVSSWDESLTSEFVENVQNMTNLEGIVVRFLNGDMLKIKTKDYLKFHKGRDILMSEHKSVELMLNQTMDDLIGLLDDASRDKLKQYQDNLWKEVDSFSSKLWFTTVEMWNRFLIQKGNCLNIYIKEDNYYVVLNQEDLKPIRKLLGLSNDWSKDMKSLMFRIWDNIDIDNVKKETLDLFKKNCHNEKQWKEFKKTFDIKLDFPIFGVDEYDQ